MKKKIKTILGFISLLWIAATALFLFVPTIHELLTKFEKSLYIGIVVIATFWLLEFCFMLYRKEVGLEVQGKIKYKRDKERKVETIDKTESLEVYTNFERAEFTSKIKDVYQKEVYSFPSNMPVLPSIQPNEQALPISQEELAKKKKPVVKIVTEDVKTEINEQIKETEAQEVEIKKQEEAILSPLALKKCKTVNCEVFKGNTVKVSEGWNAFLKEELKKDTVAAKLSELKEIYESETVVYPAKENIFKPFEYTDFTNVRVVILGKLPYYRKNQADGLAYSTAIGADINQSTDIVIQEAMDDVKIVKPENGSLVNWAKQGVLLLNTVLTAPANKPAAHTDMWKEFTTDVIKEIAKTTTPVVFLLWGEFAKEYLPFIKDNKNILVLEAANPSPLSAQSGFYGSKPFSKINEYLESHNVEKINWSL